MLLYIECLIYVTIYRVSDICYYLYSVMSLYDIYILLHVERAA